MDSRDGVTARTPRRKAAWACKPPASLCLATSWPPLPPPLPLPPLLLLLLRAIPSAPAGNPGVLQDKTLYHPVSGSCMDCSESDRRIFMSACRPASPTQQWLFEHTNSTVLEMFNRN